LCPVCAIEAGDVRVVPLEEFLKDHSLADFDEWILRWEAADGFRSEYKQRKSERLRHLRQLKNAFDSQK